MMSLMLDSCFCAISCKSESTKLEIRSVGPERNQKQWANPATGEGL